MSATVETQFESALELRQYEGVVELRKENARPFEPVDLLTGDYREELMEIAETYLSTYTGKFGFVQDVALDLRRKGVISANQAKGVLNCVVSEWNRRPKEESKLVVENTWTLPDGRYTLVRENGTHRTLKIRKRGNWFERGLPEGTRTISFLSGPDNTTNYNGFGDVLPNGEVRFWNRFRDDSILAEDTRMFLSMTKKDAIQATNNNVTIMKMTTCAICGRDLTNPSSISRGIGPECIKKF